MSEKPERKERLEELPQQQEELTPEEAEQVKGGKVSVQDFTFTKSTDKSSPTL